MYSFAAILVFDQLKLGLHNEKVRTVWERVELSRNRC